MKFIFLYIKRIFYLTIMIHSVLSVTFALLQIPHFMRLIQGVDFTIGDILLALGLRTLEWSSFLLFVSFVSSIFCILGHDIRNESIILMLQCGKNKNFLIKPAFFLSVLFSFFMLGLQGWWVPTGTLHLKQMLVDFAKEKFIAKIQPKHIVGLKDWSCCIKARPNNNTLEGVILSKKNPKVSLIVNESKLTKEAAFMKMEFSQGIGKIELQDKNIMMHFELGELLVPISKLKIKPSEKNKTLFEISNKKDFFQRSLMSFTNIISPFWVHIMFFANIWVIIAASLAFVYIIFTSLSIFHFSFGAFVFAYFGIILIYRKVR